MLLVVFVDGDDDGADCRHRLLQLKSRLRCCFCCCRWTLPGRAHLWNRKGAFGGIALPVASASELPAAAAAAASELVRAAIELLGRCCRRRQSSASSDSSLGHAKCANSSAASTTLSATNLCRQLPSGGTAGPQPQPATGPKNALKSSPVMAAADEVDTAAGRATPPYQASRRNQERPQPACTLLSSAKAKQRVPGGSSANSANRI